MDTVIKNTFLKNWEKYFPGNELPIASFYADELDGVEFPDAPKTNKDYSCVFSQLAPVQGKSARIQPGECRLLWRERYVWFF